ncbi:hypothetical protein BU16DRAFT_557240 [Lophium mytilinum]|uniref:Uncharacterized protein n=1 Tax=Lophium mytilinum TaxID=390894 RepID=A0A6A6RAL5_9PEZI|nr:hypothetical protein BU16DRAFT_557240 [Lophium mytilinum]
MLPSHGHVLEPESSAKRFAFGILHELERKRRMLGYISGLAYTNVLHPPQRSIRMRWLLRSPAELLHEIVETTLKRLDMPEDRLIPAMQYTCSCFKSKRAPMWSLKRIAKHFEVLERLEASREECLRLKDFDIPPDGFGLSSECGAQTILKSPESGSKGIEIGYSHDDPGAAEAENPEKTADRGSEKYAKRILDTALHMDVPPASMTISPICHNLDSR